MTAVVAWSDLFRVVRVRWILLVIQVEIVVVVLVLVVIILVMFGENKASNCTDDLIRIDYQL